MMSAHRFAFTWLVVVLVISGCRPEAVKAPEPIMFMATTNVVSEPSHQLLTCSLVRWKEGVEVVLVDDMGEHATVRNDSHREPCRIKGTVDSSDGRGYQWQLETYDGRSATFTIDGVAYDLTKGSVFRVAHDGQQLVVRQHALDTSKLQATNASFNEFLSGHPQLTTERQASPTPSK